VIPLTILRNFMMKNLQFLITEFIHLQRWAGSSELHKRVILLQ